MEEDPSHLCTFRRNAHTCRVLCVRLRYVTTDPVEQCECLLYRPSRQFFRLAREGGNGNCVSRCACQAVPLPPKEAVRPTRSALKVLGVNVRAWRGLQDKTCFTGAWASRPKPKCPNFCRPDLVSTKTGKTEKGNHDRLSGVLLRCRCLRLLLLGWFLDYTNQPLRKMRQSCKPTVDGCAFILDGKTCT